MTRLGVCLICVATGALFSLGCSDDATEDQPAGPAGSTTGTPGGTATGTGGSGASSSSTGTGAGGTPPNDCTAATAEEALEGDVTADKTLTADKVWMMNALVRVKSGATLTIEPCTVIKGSVDPAGVLVVEPGGKIMAEGEVDRPIVFTSVGEPGDRLPGDWGGVILEGKAPINVPGGTASIEGLDPGTVAPYGGNDPADSSGTMKFVRIEFSGKIIGANNEINGLTFGGVGSGTVIDSVMVHQTLDDCFEFFGGTVNAKHLICAGNQDDGFDWDFGYSGKLQFLALQQDPVVADDTNGFEADNDANSSTNAPISEPTIYNATLCGKNQDVDKQQFGGLFRRSTKGHLFNIIFSGFEAGVDVRDPATSIELKNSIFFGNVVQNIAYAEDGSDETVNKDDDAGFDETAWINDAANKNSETDPKLTACFQVGAPNFLPATTLSTDAATPPNDGFFDTSAAYIGAFTADDDWTHGAWVDFSTN